MQPTKEQLTAIELAAKGESMAIEARAGAGKTSTLRMIAEANSTKRIQYLAFNKAIVEEAKVKMPANVRCNTAHSLAFAAVGKHYAHRLNSFRPRSEEVARFLNLDSIRLDNGKVLTPAYLAGLVMRSITNFCHTVAFFPGPQHVPYIEGIDAPENGQRTYVQNTIVRMSLTDALRYAWHDLQQKNGMLRFQHDHYLKMWQLSDPKINADMILFDEAQDANPVLADVVGKQAAQQIYVGDSEQAIYEFTGAVDAMQSIEASHKATLSQSFRFGNDIADIANHVLYLLQADPPITGNPEINSRVEEIAQPDAVLCRTNSKAIEVFLAALENEKRPYLVGGGSEVLSFAKGAAELMERGFTSHPELTCFGSWGEVLQYVAQDEQGSEIRLMTQIVDTFGVETILKSLEGMTREEDADVVISTAHKSKGREWNSVVLAGDFPEELSKMGDSELRLLYVAVTRAQYELDISNVEALS